MTIRPQVQGRAGATVILAILVAVPAAAQDVGDTGTFDCLIEPHRVVDVGSAAVGVLDEVRVDRGHRVVEGQVVATLDSGVEAATVELARLRASIESEILARSATVEFEQGNKARTERLHATHAVAEQAREKAEHDAKVSALRLRQAREERALARLEVTRAEQALARRTVRSPLSGVVVERYKSPGERVEDEAILRLAQLDPLSIEVILPVERYGTVREGMHADVVPEYSAEGPFSAEVTAVDPVVDPASGTFGVRLSMPNPGNRLPGGLRCALRFIDGPADGASPGRGSESTPVDPPGEGSAKTPRPAPGAGGERSGDDPVREPGPQTLRPAAHERAGSPAPPGDRRAAAEPAASAPDVPTVCRSLGPFDEQVAAEVRRERLDIAGFAARLRSSDETVPAGFLVVVHVSEADGGAAAAIATLERAGIRDYQALPGAGGLVSVGYFRQLDTATTRAARMRQIGLDSRISPQVRERPSRWYVDVDLPGAADHAALLGEALGADPAPGSDPTACPGLVTVQR